MRLEVARLIRAPPFLLKALCALVRAENESAVCLLTQAQGKDIRHPAVGSDGRVYDILALRTWLATGARHVIPGCPITHVNLRVWTPSAVFRAIQSRIVRQKARRVPLQLRVIAYHASRARVPPRRSRSRALVHDPQFSAFTRVAAP